MSLFKEEIILVNTKDEEIGVSEKLQAHKDALLHRAISVFILNEKDEMLLQQRALDKYHSFGLWSNACCTHPRPNENITIAANRRLKEELGFDTLLKKIFDFTYKAELENNLTEYEFDHVFLGFHSGIVKPNPLEVNECKYLNVKEVGKLLKESPHLFTIWFQIAFPLFLNYWNRNNF
jgi:isopentenyl-diphosphate delta-isomerase